MIEIKSKREIELMRDAGKVLAEFMRRWERLWLPERVL